MFSVCDFNELCQHLSSHMVLCLKYLGLVLLSPLKKPTLNPNDPTNDLALGQIGVHLLGYLFCMIL